MTKPKYPRLGRPKRKLRIYKQHGLTHTVAYKRWKKMKDRCDSRSSGSYERYGAAGVTYCSRWIDFENFFADMGEPEPGADSLDRIDNSKGYSKENCRWVARKDQASNRRYCEKFEYDGAKLTLAEIARRTDLCRMSLRNHIKRGLSLEQAIEATNKNRFYQHRNYPVGASGFIGVAVRRLKSGIKYQATISANGSRISLGYFKEALAAAKAYDRAAKKFFGDNVRLNFREDET